VNSSVDGLMLVGFAAAACWSIRRTVLATWGGDAKAALSSLVIAGIFAAATIQTWDASQPREGTAAVPAHRSEAARFRTQAF
jgi:ABC-type uncharacterized transport system permease subunit